MSTSNLTLDSVIEQVIDRGIEGAKISYKSDPKRLAGAINGLEACRGKSPLKLIPLWQFSNKKASHARDIDSPNYWFWRCRTLEIDWVLNNVSSFLYINGIAFPWNTTSRGFMNVTSILGLVDGR